MKSFWKGELFYRNFIFFTCYLLNIRYHFPSDLPGAQQVSLYQPQPTLLQQQQALLQQQQLQVIKRCITNCKSHISCCSPFLALKAGTVKGLLFVLNILYLMIVQVQPIISQDNVIGDVTSPICHNDTYSVFNRMKYSIIVKYPAIFRFGRQIKK